MKSSTFRMTFPLGLSITLLLLVLLGFSKSFFLRPWFDTYEVHSYVLWHGGAMTAWFVWLVMQSWWIASQRTAHHRRMGLIGVAIAGVAVASAAWVNFAMLLRARRAGRDIQADLLSWADVLWSNFAPILIFSILFVGAVALRRRREVHGRLVLFASIALVDPALARVSIMPDIEILGSTLNTIVFPLGMMAALPLAVLVWDWRRDSKIHIATWCGLLAVWGLIPAIRVFVPSSAIGQLLFSWFV